MIVAGFHVPANPLLEVEGNDGAALFWHSGPICVNVAVTCAVITISIVVTVAQGSVGVNVYVVVPVVAVLIVAGFHVPANPLLEVEGNDGAALFWHSGPICVNVGVTCAVITISIVVTVAQGSVGVNVYVVVPVVAVLIVAGFHVPANPLMEVEGNDGAALFWHSGPICVMLESPVQ